MTTLMVNGEDSAILAWKFLTDPELFSWKHY
ncbi:MAG: hypothetical protein JWO13_2614 [Acidobacteriales bacterium]|nr:hypothetical protein [Terriglobales bacterium]